MLTHLEDRAAALVARGWTRREAEWLALVCLHSGVFLRPQCLAFIGRTNPAPAHRLIRRCREYAVEQPWNGSRLRVCRIAARRLYRVLGVEHVRHRRPAAPEVVLRRLLALDYLLERPRTSWLPARRREGGRADRRGDRQGRAAAQVVPGRGRGANAATSPTGCRSRSTAGGRRLCTPRTRTRRPAPFARGALSMPRCGRRSSRPAAPSR